MAADAACSALVSVPGMRAGTPKPGSALAQGLAQSLLLTHPMSTAATLLISAVNNTSAISGPPAPLRQTSKPCQLESATASPNLLLQSSQSLGSQLEPINQNSQVSDSSQIHRMMLRYSDDEITDEELQKLNLQTAAQQCMM